MMKRAFSVAVCSLFLTGCLGFGSSSENNVQLSATAGSCPAGAINAPYCMSITIQNNPGGQNYINSTNYPISSIAITTSGSSSIISPMLNAGSMDPNGCTQRQFSPVGIVLFT